MIDQHYQRYDDMIAGAADWADEDVRTLTRIIETTCWLTAKQKTALLEHLSHINPSNKSTPAHVVEPV